jgi:Ca2+-binding EF-hand superfamily protein
VLRKAFEAFDPDKKGYIETDMIGTILDMLGVKCTEEMVEEIIEEVDSDGKTKNKLIWSKNEFSKFLKKYIGFSSLCIIVEKYVVDKIKIINY